MSGAKCDSCNVVISELLAFIQNKLQVMDQVSLVQICSSAFNAEDILEAKNLLFDCIKTKKRSQRKRDGKSQRDLEDIIGLFRELDPNEFPVFVAKDLYKLPAINLDHVDVSKLLRDLLRLQNEVTNLNLKYVTLEEFDGLKADVHNIKTASIVNNFDMTNVNMVRGTSPTCYDSGPIGLLHIPVPDPKSAETSLMASQVGDQSRPANAKLSPAAPLTMSTMTKTILVSPTCSLDSSPITRNETGSVSRRKQRPEHPKYAVSTLRRLKKNEGLLGCGSGSSPGTGSKGGQAPKPVSVPAPQKSFAQIACEAGDWKDREQTTEWKMVQRRRHRNRLQTSRGEAKPELDSKFIAANLKVPLFINNVNKSTTAQDISSYILRRTEVEVSLEKINPRTDREYDAYKVIVPKSKLPMFMDVKLWPDGITFRRFVSLYRRDEARSSAPIHKQ